MSSNKLQNIAKKFIDQNFLLSVAESCTGGLLAKKITDGTEKHFKKRD